MLYRELANDKKKKNEAKTKEEGGGGGRWGPETEQKTLFFFGHFRWMLPKWLLPFSHSLQMRVFGGVWGFLRREYPKIYQNNGTP